MVAEGRSLHTKQARSRRKILLPLDFVSLAASELFFRIVLTSFRTAIREPHLII